ALGYGSVYEVICSCGAAAGLPCPSAGSLRSCTPDLPSCPASGSARLLRRGRVLEVITLGWNVAGIMVLAIVAVSARSVALAGFGLVIVFYALREARAIFLP